MTRWNLVVNDKTDESLRFFLGQRGSKKGDLSKFIEEAVLDKIFVETAASIKARNESFNQEDIINLVDEAVRITRADRS
ncbi:MAG: ribbon-helix-helix domain-containing protein [Pseudomonadota bacterium]